MIFPISHDESTVRRWPWITLAIMVLNVAVFVGTHGRMGAENERASTATDAALQYYVQHSYLAAPADLRALDPGGVRPSVGQPTSQEDFERIQREVLGRSGSAVAEAARAREERIRAEQQNLDGLVLDMRSALNDRLIVQYGSTPARYSARGFVTSQFLHTGWLHLLVNLWFLWLVGCNVEDRWGRAVFALFYLSAGVAAALIHNLLSWGSTVPVIGASGAIAGAMGAFLVRFGRTRIRFAYWYFARPGTFMAPTYLVLPLWAGKELLEWSLFGRASGVAHWAHLGGFGYGALFALVVAASRLERRVDRMLERKEIVSEQDPELAAAAALTDQGRVTEALEALERLRTNKPNDIDVRLQLLRAAQAAGDTGLQRLGRVELIALYLRQGAEDAAVDLYQELAQRGAEGALPSELRLRIARRLERQGSPVRAEQEYEKLYSGSLEDEVAFQAVLAHAALCVRQGRKAAALELYGTATKAVWAHLLLESTLQQGLRDARAMPDEPPKGPRQHSDTGANSSNDDAPEIESGEAPALILMDRSEPPGTDRAPTWPASVRGMPMPTLVSAGVSGSATPIESARQAWNVSSPAPAAGRAVLGPGLPYSQKPNRPDDAGRYSLRPGSMVEVPLAATPSNRARSSASGARQGTRKPAGDDQDRSAPEERTDEHVGVTRDPRRR